MEFADLNLFVNSESHGETSTIVVEEGKFTFPKLFMRGHHKLVCDTENYLELENVKLYFKQKFDIKLCENNFRYQAKCKWSIFKTNLRYQAVWKWQ